MKRFIAKVPCKFAGRQFYIGEMIPGELILSPKVQEEMGTISVLEVDEKATQTAETVPQAARKQVGRKGTKAGGV